MSRHGGEGHRGTLVRRENPVFGAAVPATVGSPTSFKSRESRECAAASMIFSENPERSRFVGDRVAFTMGRDLALKPPQRDALPNYFIYPYAELDGAPLAQDKIKSSFAYHDVSPGK